jgi:hypothetical protein
MEINKNNYEAFLLDLMEGKLSSEERNAVLLFLEKHPEIEFDYDLSLPEITVDDALSFGAKNNLKHLVDEKEESVVFYLDGVLSGEEKLAFETQLKKDESLQALVKQYENIKLEPETIAFPMATSSLFKFSEKEEELISYSEGLLTQNESNKILVKAQADEVLMKELQTYKAAKTHSDLSIVYPNKEELKKSAIIVFLRSNVSYLSIAASLVLLLMVFYPSNELQISSSALAVKNSFQLKNVKKGNNNGVLNVEPRYVEDAVKTKNNAFANYIVKKDTSVNENNKKSPSNNNQIIEPLIATNNTSKVKEPAPHPYNPVVINYYDEKEPELIAQVQPKKTETSFVQKMQNSAWENVGKAPANVAEEETKSKSKRMNLLALIGNGLKKMGVKKSGAQKIYHEDEDYVEYNVNIAGITITKKELN